MDRTERVELTTCTLLRRDGEILLQNRVKADWTGYALPGGHVDPGESIVDSAVREMQEETGLTILVRWNGFPGTVWRNIHAWMTWNVC